MLEKVELTSVYSFSEGYCMCVHILYTYIIYMCDSECCVYTCVCVYMMCVLMITKKSFTDN